VNEAQPWLYSLFYFEDGREMNVDLLITLVVLGMAFLGHKRRTFSELLALFGFVAALAATTLALPYVASALVAVLHRPSYAIAVSLLLVFALGLLVLRFPGRFMRRHVELKVTESADRLIGLLIGLYKGLVWGGLISIFLMLVPIRGPVDLRVDQSNFARQSRKVVPLTIDVARKFVPNMGHFVGYVEAAYLRADSTESDSLVNALVANLKDVKLDSLKFEKLKKAKMKLDSLKSAVDE